MELKSRKITFKRLFTGAALSSLLLLCMSLAAAQTATNNPAGYLKIALPNGSYPDSAPWNESDFWESITAANRESTATVTAYKLSKVITADVVREAMGLSSTAETASANISGVTLTNNGLNGIENNTDISGVDVRKLFAFTTGSYSDNYIPEGRNMGNGTYHILYEWELYDNDYMSNAEDKSKNRWLKTFVDTYSDLKGNPYSGGSGINGMFRSNSYGQIIYLTRKIDVYNTNLAGCGLSRGTYNTPRYPSRLNDYSYTNANDGKTYSAIAFYPAAYNGNKMPYTAPAAGSSLGVNQWPAKPDPIAREVLTIGGSSYEAINAAEFLTNFVVDPDDDTYTIEVKGITGASEFYSYADIESLYYIPKKEVFCKVVSGTLSNIVNYPVRIDITGAQAYSNGSDTLPPALPALPGYRE